MEPKVTQSHQWVDTFASPEDEQSAQSCPICGGDDISTTWESHGFDYGSGESLVKLELRMPVRRCGTCEFVYLDDIAERLKHRAICVHLGVLSPDQIRKIREGHGMTRAAFARLTGLGEASLNRWENGLAIQSHANDRYLRLLMGTANVQRLQEVALTRQSGIPVTADARNRYRTLKVTPEVLTRQAGFRLRRAA